jgi:hypothetical protein
MAVECGSSRTIWSERIRSAHTGRPSNCAVRFFERHSALDHQKLRRRLPFPPQLDQELVTCSGRWKMQHVPGDLARPLASPFGKIAFGQRLQPARRSSGTDAADDSSKNSRTCAAGPRSSRTLCGGPVNLKKNCRVRLLCRFSQAAVSSPEPIPQTRAPTRNSLEDGAVHRTMGWSHNLDGRLQFHHPVAPRAARA